MIRLHMLGRLALEKDGVEIAANRQALVVLAVLAMQDGRSMDRDDLGRLLWPHSDVHRARQSLRQERHELRSWTNHECVLLEGRRLILSEGVVTDFEELCEAIRKNDSRATIELFNAPLLGGFGRELPTDLSATLDAAEQGIRASVEHACINATDKLVSVGRSSEAVDLLLRLSRLEPRSESVQLLVARRLWDIGEAGLALSSAEAFLGRLSADDDSSPRAVALIGEIRAEVDRSLDSPAARNPRQPGWQPWQAAFVGVAILVLGSLGLSRTRPELPPSWAKGHLLISNSSGAALFEFGTQGELVLTDSSVIDGDYAPTAIVPTGGGNRVLAVRRQEDRPQAIATRMATGWNVVWESHGDMSAAVSAPDGMSLLVAAEDVRAAEYQLDVHHVDLMSGGRHLVFSRQGGWPGDVAWSADGSQIVVVNAYSEGPDSLHVLRPNGQLLASWPVPGSALKARFCGPDQLVVIARPDAALPAVFLIERKTGTASEIRIAGSPTSIACSPDGRYLLHGDNAPDEARLVLYDLDSAADIHSWRVSPFTYLAWFPPGVRLPHVVDASIDSVRVPWGGRTGVRAVVTDAQGEPWPGRVEWLSLDPRVAQVRDSVVVGNRPGTARIVALANGWLSDTIEVTVTDVAGPTAFIADRLTSFDAPRTWQPLGEPIPAIEPGADGPVLRMRGDGAYADGMISTRAFPWSEGVTVTLDFRLNLTLREKQSVMLCLLETTLPAQEHLGHFPAYDRRTQGCLRYPNAETVRFRDSKVSFQNGADVQLDVSSLPATGWTSIGLQLYPDGRLEALVNDEVVGTHPLLMNPLPEAELRVAVFGREFETELFVRNLVVWRGARYP